MSTEATAFHEARHAVIGRRLGLTLKHVRISNDPIHDGEALWIIPKDGGHNVHRGKLYMLEAGLCAQRIHCGSIEGCKSDLREIRKCLRRLRWQDYDSPTIGMVRADWAAISAVAQSLLHKHKLSGDQVDQLMLKAVRS
jgi:hypothetical protein